MCLFPALNWKFFLLSLSLSVSQKRKCRPWSASAYIVLFLFSIWFSSKVNLLIWMIQWVFIFHNYYTYFCFSYIKENSFEMMPAYYHHSAIQLVIHINVVKFHSPLSQHNIVQKPSHIHCSIAWKSAFYIHFENTTAHADCREQQKKKISTHSNKRMYAISENTMNLATNESNTLVLEWCGAFVARRCICKRK